LYYTEVTLYGRNTRQPNISMSSSLKRARDMLNSHPTLEEVRFYYEDGFEFYTMRQTSKSRHRGITLVRGGWRMSGQY
jgi:hypothetical protein